MRDDVVISHRGAAYEIGRGRGFYGIWPAGAPRAQPCEWWPPTSAGWSGAWSRFTWLEPPGSIVAVSRPQVLPFSASTRAICSAVLLAVGVVFGVGALFPTYIGASLASQPPQLWPHVLDLAAWAGSAVLIMLGGRRLRAGALIAAGTSIVAFGFYASDLGMAVSSPASSAGAGLLLALAGWVACAAGSVMATCIHPADDSVRPYSFGRGSAPRLALILAAGLGAAVFFAPAWDSYRLHTAAGGSQTVTLGNAFAEPSLAIAGNVLVMLAVLAVVAVAATLRPAWQGGLLLAGALVPVAGQAISAVIGFTEPVSPELFGVSQGQAAVTGLTISPGLTPWFWIYCAFVVALALIGARMLIPARAAAILPPPAAFPAAPQDVAPPAQVPPVEPPVAPSASGQPG